MKGCEDMTNQSSKKNMKIPLLWQVFRNEALEIKLSPTVIERIKLRLKEKINKKNEKM